MVPNAERGFTLIELLVVMLILGILAAIAVPAFINQRAKGQDAEAKSTAAVAVRALEIYHQDHGAFAGVTVAALADIEPSLAGAQGLVVTPTADGYTLSVDSASGASGGGPFAIERTATGTDSTCGAPGEGGCPNSGHW